MLNSYTDNDNNVIAEVSTVVRERNGHIESRLDFSRARNVRRRKRDLKVKIAEPKFQLTVERDVKVVCHT